MAPPVADMIGLVPAAGVCDDWIQNDSDQSDASVIAGDTVGLTPPVPVAYPLEPVTPTASDATGENTTPSQAFGGTTVYVSL